VQVDAINFFLRIARPLQRGNSLLAQSTFHYFSSRMEGCEASSRVAGLRRGSCVRSEISRLQKHCGLDKKRCVGSFEVYESQN